MKKAKEPLAIIGIGCRFPGNVNSPEEFWDLIINGGDGLSDIPPDRWNADAKFAPGPKRMLKRLR
ncbi:MAG: beta-ketoacyl synthase N-terminal-like domain-containing protein [Bacteroidales bacterium]